MGGCNSFAGTKDQAHTVTAIHITYTDRDYTDVTIATPDGAATITGTAHHPYWDQTTHAWTDADHLHTGDRLQTTDGNTVTIVALRHYTATTVTYNTQIRCHQLAQNERPATRVRPTRSTPLQKAASGTCARTPGRVGCARHSFELRGQRLAPVIVSELR